MYESCIDLASDFSIWRFAISILPRLCGANLIRAFGSLIIALAIQNTDKDGSVRRGFILFSQQALQVVPSVLKRM